METGDLKCVVGRRNRSIYTVTSRLSLRRSCESTHSESLGPWILSVTGSCDGGVQKDHVPPTSPIRSHTWPQARQTSQEQGS